MGHEEIFARLGAYLDGETTPAEREAIEAHLKACFPCQSEVARLRQLSTVLRGLPGPAISPAFQQRLDAAIQRAGRRRLERFAGMLSGIAACIAIGGIFMLTQTRAAGPGGTLAQAPAAWEGVATQSQQLASTDDPASPDMRELALAEWMVTDLSQDAPSGGGAIPQ